MTQTPPTTHSSVVAPHRGVLILVFGILSIVLCAILGPFAWIMGKGDLKRIDAGTMDREGRGLTQAGMICGIIGTVFLILSVLMILLYVVLIALGLGLAAAGAAGGAGGP
ncbi:MAG: hypothetical protein AMXMBFR77_09970 [Phycisphaerales bacterium]|nr:MAG: hypothetical protein BroJett004_03730 [Planctomycetota bacterium]